MDSRCYPITESQFSSVIEPLILSYKKPAGRPPKSSNYKTFCGILYVLRTGIPWRDLPVSFGRWHTIYTRFKCWSDSGLFWNIIKECHKNKSATFDMVWLDSTAIKLHRHGAGASKKRGCNQ
jgi:transposase